MAWTRTLLGARGSLLGFASLVMLLIVVLAAVSFVRSEQTGHPHAPGVVATQFGAFDPNPAPGTPLIPRNYGNGPPLFTLNLRLNKTIGFGGSRSGQGGKRRIAKKQRDSESQAKIDENNYSSIFHTDKSDQRFNLTFSITARNLFNNVNQGAPIGSLSSPAFGTSNWLASSGNPYHPSYGNNRTVQLEVRLGF